MEEDSLKETSFTIFLNVQGVIFESTRDVFFGSETLKKLIEWAEREKKPQPYFVNRSSMLFKHVIARLVDPSYIPPWKCYNELEYFQIPLSTVDVKNLCMASEKQETSFSFTGPKFPGCTLHSIRIPKGVYESVTTNREETVFENSSTYSWIWCEKEYTLYSGKGTLSLNEFINTKTEHWIRINWEFISINGAPGYHSPPRVDFIFSYRPLPENLN